MADLLVNIDVDDLEMAAAFYTTAFGLRVGRRLGTDAIELLGRSAPIYLLAQPAGSRATVGTDQRREYGRHWTPVHLDFVVDEIDAAERCAREAGATLEAPVMTHPWGRLAVMADPFGNGFCLVQFTTPGYDAVATR